MSSTTHKGSSERRDITVERVSMGFHIHDVAVLHPVCPSQLTLAKTACYTVRAMPLYHYQCGMRSREWDMASKWLVPRLVGLVGLSNLNINQGLLNRFLGRLQCIAGASDRWEFLPVLLRSMALPTAKALQGNCEIVYARKQRCMQHRCGADTAWL